MNINLCYWCLFVFILHFWSQIMSPLTDLPQILIGWSTHIPATLGSRASIIIYLDDCKESKVSCSPSFPPVYACKALPAGSYQTSSPDSLRLYIPRPKLIIKREEGRTKIERTQEKGENRIINSFTTKRLYSIHD